MSSRGKPTWPLMGILSVTSPGSIMQEHLWSSSWFSVSILFCFLAKVQVSGHLPLPKVMVVIRGELSLGLIGLQHGNNVRGFIIPLSSLTFILSTVYHLLFWISFYYLKTPQCYHNGVGFLLPNTYTLIMISKQVFFASAHLWNCTQKMR